MAGVAAHEVVVPPADEEVPPSPAPTRHRAWSARLLFALGAVAVLTPIATPAMALSGGAALGLTLGDPLGGRSQHLSAVVLKLSVVGLGFGLSIQSVIQTGRSGIVFIAIGIAAALGVGGALGRWLRVERETSTLISGGTAICGGSAIAAMAPVLGASSTSISVAMATVFLLNGASLYLFPPIGHAVGLSQDQFGMWAAIAIHDTSSVLGAATEFGTRALELATVLKLTRALWILPLVAGIALWRRRSGPVQARVSPPWFIGLFLAASGLRALLPGGVGFFDVLDAGARRLLVLALFLVGVSLTRSRLADVGLRPFIQGLMLWVFVAAGSLMLLLSVPDLVSWIR